MLSIVIPVYNIRKELLVKSLSSVIQKKSVDTEIIIVDDGSVAETAAICDEYEDKSNNVRVFHQKNQGVSVARNQGIKCARGEYISFIDSDDVVDMEAISKVVGVANENELDICIFKYRRDANFEGYKDTVSQLETFDVDYESMVYSIAIQKENFDGYCIGSPWGKIFSKDFLVKNELFFLDTLRKMQDRVFMMYCLMKRPQLGFVPIEGYCYVINEESIVNKYNPNIGNYINNVYKEILSFNKKYELFKEKELGTIVGKLVMEYLGLDILHKKNDKSKKQKAMELNCYMEKTGFNLTINDFYKSEFNRNEIIKMKLLRFKYYYLLIVFSSLYSR